MYFCNKIFCNYRITEYSVNRKKKQQKRREDLWQILRHVTRKANVSQLQLNWQLEAEYLQRRTDCNGRKL